MATNQFSVLKALYWRGKKTNVSEIAKDTSLKKKQVYMAVWALKKRGYVKVDRTEMHWEDGEMVPPKIFVELCNPQLTESTLKKRGMI